MRITLAAALLILAPSLAFAYCKDKQADCGTALKQSGWSELARCFDGHQWSYVLENQNEKKLCKGINAVPGPSETPCVSFEGDLEKFKTVAVKAKNQTAAKEQNKMRINCWEI